MFQIWIRTNPQKAGALKKDPKCKDVTKKPMTKEEREAKKKAKEAEAK